MPEENDFHVFEIAVGDFDLNLIPAEARSPGTEKFEAAVKNFYEDQLRKVAVNYTGDYASGVQILEFLVPSRAQDAVIHYNLGMAYSDLGKLDQSIDHLQRALKIEKGMVNAKVALGVAYARLKQYDKSAVILKEAVLEDPDNGYALRNLGAVIMQSGRDKSDGLRYLRRAVELLPQDQQAWFGLAQAQMDTGDSDTADASLIQVIEIQPYSPIAETAKQMRSRLAQEIFRTKTSSGLRMDAVMYCLGALKKFAEVTPEEVRKVGFEIATLGMNGINVNDPKSEYHLRTLPGIFSGLQLLCYEYVAFKQFAPDIDIGFDVTKEYEEANRMMAMGL